MWAYTSHLGGSRFVGCDTSIALLHYQTKQHHVLKADSSSGWYQGSITVDVRFSSYYVFTEFRFWVAKKCELWALTRSARQFFHALKYLLQPF